MRIVRKIAARCAPFVDSVHKARQRLVWDLVSSLTCRGAVAKLSSIGSKLPRQVMGKHALKCADRALSNKNLHSERNVWYGAISRTLMSPQSRPVILVDATELCDGFGSMRASLAVDGRAVTLWDFVAEKDSLMKPKSLQTFLSELDDVLPEGCRPILVVDGGFRGPFFKQVQDMGWDFVGRLSRNTWIQSPKDKTQAKTLFARATKRPRSLGPCSITRRAYSAHVVLYDGRSARARKSAKRKKIRGQNRERKRRSRAYEPWVLVTSCSSMSARRIMRLYSYRMQIEESFRDDKSQRFGFGLEMARCKSATRLANLLLIVALASWVLMVVGHFAEVHDLQRHYCANTIRKRRSLSVWTLGRRLIERPPNTPILQEGIGLALQRIQALALQCAT